LSGRRFRGVVRVSWEDGVAGVWDCGLGLGTRRNEFCVLRPANDVSAWTREFSALCKLCVLLNHGMERAGIGTWALGRGPSVRAVVTTLTLLLLWTEQIVVCEAFLPVYISCLLIYSQRTGYQWEALNRFQSISNRPVTLK
jgi:hypothetical protein